MSPLLFEYSSIFGSDHLNFILKCFEMISFNDTFKILLVRFFLLFIYDSYIIVKKFWLDYSKYLFLTRTSKPYGFLSLHSCEIIISKTFVHTLQRTPRVFIWGLRIYCHALYIWAEWACLVLTSSRFALLSNVFNIGFYPE